MHVHHAPLPIRNKIYLVFKYRMLQGTPSRKNTSSFSRNQLKEESLLTDLEMELRSPRASRPARASWATLGMGLQSLLSVLQPTTVPQPLTPIRTQ
jgi:hypothetical protein